MVDEIQKSEQIKSSLSTPNSRIILVTGGARSGKSTFALKMAESIPGERLFIATAEALDEEMAGRIEEHKRGRGSHWATVEEPIAVPAVVGREKGYGVILLDCLTIWISNLLLQPSVRKVEGGTSEGVSTAAAREIDSFIGACKESNATVIVVSNEVGMGIVPETPLARQFRDMAGIANQQIAAAADEVYLLVSGIEMRIK
ncbi:MAG: bifunctional adenosylcobinamide kinase/adenosylcobinamide-phosphate guanylyltransferase [Thermodesulfobacteriota bacterium]